MEQALVIEEDLDEIQFRQAQIHIAQIQGPRGQSARVRYSAGSENSLAPRLTDQAKSIAKSKENTVPGSTQAGTAESKALSFLAADAMLASIAKSFPPCLSCLVGFAALSNCAGAQSQL